jgi:hypothetical protein
MTSDLPEGDRLWEALSKYGQVPPPEIWTRLEPFALRRLASNKLSPDAKRRLTEMAVMVWAWSKEPGSSYSISAAALRSALSLAMDDVRTQAAWHFQSLFRGSKSKAGKGANAWHLLGKAFFAEVWPLESTLQSPNTSNHLAGIPGNVGETYFAEAVDTILPFLRAFEVWSISSEFWFGKDEPTSMKVVVAHPEATLRLLAACISPAQQHRVMELGAVLDRLVTKVPSLQSDVRVRTLRRLADE